MGWQEGGGRGPAVIQGSSLGDFVEQSARTWAIWAAIQKAESNEG